MILYFYRTLRGPQVCTLKAGKILQIVIGVALPLLEYRSLLKPSGIRYGQPRYIGCMTDNFQSFSTARGMHDLLPEDMRSFRYIEDTFRKISSNWGYEELRTPTIENYSLFTSAGGLTPESLTRAYTFLDWDGWSGERVMLRYDSTISVARAVTLASLGLPARLFYVQSAFRFNESEDQGEEWQCGLEYLDAIPQSGELEVVTLAAELFSEMKIPAQIKLSHSGIVRAVFEMAEIDDMLVRRNLLTRIASEGEGVFSELLEGNASALALITAIYADVNQSPEVLANFVALASAGLPEAIPALTELKDLAEILVSVGRNVCIDLSMQLDFEYYDGIFFEFIDTKNLKSLGRGGRYKPNLEGGLKSAVGFALDIPVLLGHLQLSRMPERGQVNLLPSGKEDFSYALQIADVLHENGVIASLDGKNSADIVVEIQNETISLRRQDDEHEEIDLASLLKLVLEEKGKE